MPLTQTSIFISKENANYYMQFLFGHIWTTVMSCTIKPNKSFKEKLKSIQYNECLALVGGIRCTLKEKNFKNWDWSPLEIDTDVEDFAFFYKVQENKNPKYLLNLIPARRSLYSTRNIHNIPFLNTKHTFSKTLFFLRL